MGNGRGDTLDVGRMRLLREVGLRGSIAAAARALGLTPSAVSQQLAALEREAGTALVDRTPRGVALTGAGQVLAVRAEEVLDLLAAARADLDRMGDAVGGSVAIAAVASAAATVVSRAVTALRGSHPGVHVRVGVAEPMRALERLLAGDVELAVVDEYDYVPLAVPDYVVTQPLCREPLVLVLPRGEAAPAPVTLAALAERSWVMPPEEAACGQAVRSACRAAGFEPRVAWETDDLLLLARAVEAGHGVAVLPRLAVADDVAAVRWVRLGTPRLQRRISVAARASALGRPIVANVRDALVAASL